MSERDKAWDRATTDLLLLLRKRPVAPEKSYDDNVRLILDDLRARLRSEPPTEAGEQDTDEGDPTASMVQGFADAVKAKLRAADEKYGHGLMWRDDPNFEGMRQELREHMAKGDPRDVAAYCAFLWYHDEPTSPPPSGEPTEALSEVAQKLAANMQTLDPEANRAIYENLWALYTDEPVEPAPGVDPVARSLVLWVAEMDSTLKTIEQIAEAENTDEWGEIRRFATEGRDMLLTHPPTDTGAREAMREALEEIARMGCENWPDGHVITCRCNPCIARRALTPETPSQGDDE
jgi:hypothetical protein